MTRYFFPGCKVKRRYPQASEKLAEIVIERGWADEVTSCCRVNHQKLADDDVAVCICNNCMAMIDEDSTAKVENVWQLMDADEGIELPSYEGKVVTVQDCGRAWDRSGLQDAIRSLLAKMGIEVVEADDARNKTIFCGASFMHAVPKMEAEFAPRRYVEEAAERGFYVERTDEEIAEALKKQVDALPCKDVACYCFACDMGLEAGGANPVNLIELTTGAFRERD